MRLVQQVGAFGLSGDFLVADVTAGRVLQFRVP
jgi:hypothetical protein